MTTPLPDLVVYARPGCHLCEETIASLRLILADRSTRGLAVPPLVETNIEADPELHRAMLEKIPVVSIGEYRLELATSVAGLQRLLATALDGARV